MKKVITSILAVSMLGAMSVTAFAADNTTLEGGTTGDTSHDVQVKYDDSTNTTIYSVDIVWGDMQFNYSAGTWDPAQHKYTGDTGFTPKTADTGNKVTITSHTNKELTASVAYANAGSYNLTGTITPSGDQTIATAVGTTTDNPPKQEFTLALSGTLSAELADYTKVGTLTITLA